MKKFLVILISCVLVASAIFGIYKFWFLPEYYNVRIGIATTSGTEQYLEDFIISYSHMPKKAESWAEKMSDDKNEFRMAFYEEHKEDNYHISIDITVDNGTTTVTYHGTITDSETGLTENYKKDFVYDFVLTEDIH